MRALLPVLIGALLLSAAPTAFASGQLQAVGDWTVAPQSRDKDGDGFIDGDGGVPKSGPLSAEPSRDYVGAGNRIAQPNERLINGNLSWYLPTRGYTVTLDACRSRGTTFTWTIRQGTRIVQRTKPARLSKKTCVREVRLREGTYRFTLTVEGQGKRLEASMPAKIRGLTVLSLGDSYASGEGNPRNIAAWQRLGNPLGRFTPYWDDDACRRSTRAAPAQAALALEKSDPRTPVTFVHLACSGATIARGILGPQAGQRLSQIDQARDILGNQRIDAIVLSIGGNDVGFTSIIETCLLNTDCPLVSVTTGVLAGAPTMQAGVQTRLGQLPAGYQSVAKALAQLAPNAPVFITMYPDITRNANGAPCRYFTMAPNDFAWARDTLLVPNPGTNYPYVTTQGQTVTFPLPNGSLNGQIAATQSLGFQPVTGSWSASGDSAIGHGICAGAQSWVIPPSLNGNARGAFHPNPPGQVAIAQAIATALKSISPPKQRP
jgi:lysophospholipase L1-like esterase